MIEEGLSLESDSESEMLIRTGTRRARDNEGAELVVEEGGVSAESGELARMAAASARV